MKRNLGYSVTKLSGLILFAIILVVSCTKQTECTDPVPPKPPQNSISITLVCTGDIHEFSKNIAKLSTFINQLRSREGSWVYLFMAGDFYLSPKHYDTWLCDDQKITGEAADLKVPKEKDSLYYGLAMSDIIEYLRYDALVPGNHDWKYGTSALAAARYKDKLVACNVTEPKNLTRDFLTIYSEKGRFNINVIGATFQNHLHKKNGDILTIHSIKTQTSERIINTSCKPGDINVLLTHLPDDDDLYALDNFSTADKKPPFDVLFGGHSHLHFARIVNGAAYIKTGIAGNYVGICYLEWDTVKKVIVNKTVKQVCLEGYDPDPKMVDFINQLKEKYPHQ